MLIFILTLSDDEQITVEVIYKEYSDAMYRVAMKNLKSEDDAEVAVQETFAKIRRPPKTLQKVL